MTRNTIVAQAQAIYDKRYPEAASATVARSPAPGPSSPASTIDLSAGGSPRSGTVTNSNDDSVPVIVEHPTIAQLVAWNAYAAGKERRLAQLAADADRKVAEATRTFSTLSTQLDSLRSTLVAEVDRVAGSYQSRGWGDSASVMSGARSASSTTVALSQPASFNNAKTSVDSALTTLRGVTTNERPSETNLQVPAIAGVVAAAVFGIGSSSVGVAFFFLVLVFGVGVGFQVYRRNEQRKQILDAAHTAAGRARSAFTAIDSARGLLRQDQDRTVSAARTSQSDAGRKIEETLEAMRDVARLRCSPLLAAARVTHPAWFETTHWNHWEPPVKALQSGLRGYHVLHALFGPADDQTAEERAASLLPDLVTLPDRLSLLVQTDVPAETVSEVGGLLFRHLTSFPAARLQMTLIDPVGLGKNAASLLDLGDHGVEALITTKAWSEPRDIEARLAELSLQIETIIQKNLRNTYVSLEEYNRQAGVLAEPYRLLVVYDFPENFTPEAAKRLTSIIKSGPRCGVHTIVVHDTNKELPYGFRVEDWYGQMPRLVRDASGFYVDPDGRHGFGALILLETLPEEPVKKRITDRIGRRAAATKDVVVPFSRIAPAEEHRWAESTATGIDVPIGIQGANRLQRLTLGLEGTTAHHGLLVGRPGSGKSVLLHSLIMSLALTYSPEELELYLIDFKRGVEFKTYAVNGLPHARLLAIESEREFALSALRQLDSILETRSKLFKAATSAGDESEGLVRYRAQTGKSLSRILLVVDEFHEFFTQDDAIATESGLLLDRLIRQGRAYGLHVLLCSQTLEGTSGFRRTSANQMALRIALQCSESDSRSIFADDNDQARLLARPGEAIYNPSGGLKEHNVPFQVVLLDADERTRLLGELREMAARMKLELPPPIVFDGEALASVTTCAPVVDLVARDGTGTGARDQTVWIGNPVAIDAPVSVTFKRSAGHNLLVVGQNQDAGAGLMSSVLLGLALQTDHAAEGPTIHLADLMASADEPQSLADLAARFPHAVRVIRKREVVATVGRLAAEVRARIEGERFTEPPTYLLLHGLQRARDLRIDEDAAYRFSPEDETDEPVSRQLATILREGPEVGVFVVTWCDTLPNLNRSVDRRMQREFDLRVVFQTSADASTDLIDSPAAARLGPFRAIFAALEDGRVVKFGPYGLPPLAWLDATLPVSRPEQPELTIVHSAD